MKHFYNVHITKRKRSLNIQKAGHFQQLKNILFLQLFQNDQMECSQRLHNQEYFFFN